MPTFNKVSKCLKKGDTKWYTREFIFKRGLMFGFILLGMTVAFPLQLFSPLPRDGWLFFQQSFGFGVMYAGLKVFMSVTFYSWVKDIVNRTKNTLNSDKGMFLAMFLSFSFILWVIESRGWENPVLMISNLAATVIIMAFMCTQKNTNDSNDGGGSGKGKRPKLQGILKNSEFIVR